MYGLATAAATRQTPQGALNFEADGIDKRLRDINIYYT